MADENKLRSIAFCCISTGEFRFPDQLGGMPENQGSTISFNEDMTTVINDIKNY
jgi:hypothetical protein